MMDKANIIYASSIGAWNNIEYIILDGKKLTYTEVLDATFNIILSNYIVEVIDGSGRAYPLPCLSQEVLGNTYGKAKLLLDGSSELPSLSENHNYVIVQQKCSGISGEGSDSGDEAVPYPAIDPPFSEMQLGVVQFCFDRLKKAYLSARAVGFVNCCGKNFFERMCDYTNHCCSNKDEHLHLINTAKGSFQPGAFYVKWAIPNRPLRTSQSSVVPHTHERYADGVAYNVSTFLNEVVAEIKWDNENEDYSDSEPTTARAQHNEQMVGLWQPEQQAMLGLEFYTDYVVPKILLLDSLCSELRMFYLERLELSNPGDVGSLTKLIITFIAYVQCCKPQTCSQ